MALLTIASTSSATPQELSDNSATFVTEEVTFNNNGRVVLLFYNGSASPVTVTIATPFEVEGLSLDDMTLELTAGDIVLVGPFNPRYYNDGEGVVTMTTAGEEGEVEVMGFYR